MTRQDAAEDLILSRFRASTLNDLLFPSRDEAIGAIVKRFSETTEAPASDNFISNEDSFPRILGELARRVEPSSVYIGVGPDQNFSMIAQAQPSLAFLIDFRRRNLLLHLLHKALFALAHDRVDYLRRLTCRQPIKPITSQVDIETLADAFSLARFDHSILKAQTEAVSLVVRSFGILRSDEFSELATIQARLAGPGLNARFLGLGMYPTSRTLMLAKDREGSHRHFLNDEALYQEVRERQIHDRLIPIVADFAGPHTFVALGKWLRERSFAVGVMYVSDVEFFLLRSGKFPAYLANLEQLPWSKSAIIVRTSTREILHPSRFPGDSSTTIAVSVSRFLKAAHAGKFQSADDLFDLDKNE